jgi:hypothetical protein
MAVLMQLTVTPADRDRFDELDEKLGESMAGGIGGPPPGLMSHVVYPDDGGFIVADVWRTESEGRSFVELYLQPMLTRLGLTATEAVVRPVWSFARP